MKKSFFSKAGIHGVAVPHRKYTQDSENTELIRPGRVTLLMSQHIGAPAVPCVKKGDGVYVGTLVGEAKGFVSANIYSSVSGTVADVADVVTAQGSHCQAVIVDSNGEFTSDPGLTAPEVTDAKSLIDAVRAAGLVGLGGAGFPTHVKLSLPEGSHVDTLLINAAECEPYITSDYREMIDFPERIIKGVQIIRDTLGLERAIIAVEDNKPQAIETLKRFAGYKNIEVVSLKSRYPQGAEKVLITNVTGRVVPAGKLPADAGCIVMNVTSVSSFANFVETGMPIVSHRVTVAGGAITNPGNYMVPIGTSISEVIEAAGGYSKDCARLLLGGPMMGNAIYDDSLPTTKTTNAVLALSADEMYVPVNGPCIRCGKCNDHCPVNLSPAEIQLAYECGDIQLVGNLGVNNCIECGSCSFVCPAKRSVTQTMRLCKAALRKEAAKK